ncbi:M20 family metallopeptidase [Acerihabitans sp. TG2]|uniref:M20 family metallopeptidase n=1 Tax=Acerihabitans sp. TG2 TaxID=3096008 RepID=UPI002B236921|nr:M20 family metallopeptidase [Acerihabitans sp. TG2]MEA9392089.1 M20 family metallopeptidase [Acerihabitans sp. TG2]
MTRDSTVQAALDYFHGGEFRKTLTRRIAYQTESENPQQAPAIMAYLSDEITPQLESLGFSCQIIANPQTGKNPFLLARRLEADADFTLLTYGHGDVVLGDDANWHLGLSPWELHAEGNRWYGRGTADNKGQHSINLAALAIVLNARGGRLGYNVKLIFEMGEEGGSPGLEQVCQQYRDWLAADLFIASDGPRVSAERPTLFLGSRGVFNFSLQVKLRDGAHHSGNWGGLLSNPGIRLAHAIACLVDANGRIQVPELLPAPLSATIRHHLAGLELGTAPGDPQIAPCWGEPGLSAAEKLYGWNTLETLAFTTGNPAKPAHAIPPSALAHCHMRYVPGSDVDHFAEHIRHHLDRHGFSDVAILGPVNCFKATRIDPDNAWVRWSVASIDRSVGKTAAVLPNFGGGLPNACFLDTFGVPTLWIPHSYPACSQHAPNEHLLADVACEALQMMTGLFWDLTEQVQALACDRHG